ncbi:hypothetical protein N7526_011527 [Penicillium atrosanguineum]|nr:hypothetical protein N7526_011527 [Penicillium atrosanguineum]
MPRSSNRQIISNRDVDHQLNDMSDNDQDSGYESGSALDAYHISDEERNDDDLEDTNSGSDNDDDLEDTNSGTDNDDDLEDTNSGTDNESDPGKVNHVKPKTTKATNAAPKKQQAKKVNEMRKASNEKPTGTAKLEAGRKPKTAKPRKATPRKPEGAAESKTKMSCQTTKGKATKEVPKSAAKSMTKPFETRTDKQLGNAVPHSRTLANLWGDDPLYADLVQKVGTFIVGVIVVLVQLSIRQGAKKKG